MTAMSDRLLRRSAWVGPWFLLAAVAVRLATHVASPYRSATAWPAALDAFGFVLVVSAFVVTGALIVRRQPRNTIGWLLQAIGVVSGVGLLADSYARYGLLISPGSVPGADVAAVLNEGMWAPVIGLMGTFLLLLYPDGQLPSPRWRVVAWLCGMTIAGLTATMYLTPGRLAIGPLPTLTNPLGWESAQPYLAVLLRLFLVLLPVCIVACAFALVRRFRRSQGTERLQLTWLAAAGAAVALVFLLGMAASLLVEIGPSRAQPVWLTVLDHVSFLSFALLPAAIGTAILRHRLYGIDVIINRALVYGSVTATLAGVYLASVLLLQLLLNPLTRESDLAVAGSTLAVAALFRPARFRFQAAVDRRFYRSRYDAARTLDEFAAKLRHELDVDAVGADLRQAVSDTVQPAHVSLWLRA